MIIILHFLYFFDFSCFLLVRVVFICLVFFIFHMFFSDNYLAFSVFFDFWADLGQLR